MIRERRGRVPAARRRVLPARLRAGLLAVLAGALAPLRATAQERPPEAEPYSIDQVAEAVAADLNTNMLERARASCISFVVDATAERRLRAAGAEPDFTAALRGVCFRGTSLEVTTEPAGAEVWVEGRRVGTTPWMSPMPVQRNLPVEVRLAGRYRRVRTNTIADSLLSIHFVLQRDTVPLPPGPSDMQLQTLRAQADGFRPRSRPAPPRAPARGRSARSVLVGGLAGAAVGFAAGSVGCRQNEVIYRRIPFGDDVILTPIDTVEKVQRRCVGFSIGAGAVGGGLAGNLFAALTAGRRRRAFEEELRIHERQVARWEQQRQAAEQLRQQEARRAERLRVAAANAEITAANRTLGEPTIRTARPVRLERAVRNDGTP